MKNWSASHEAGASDILPEPPFRAWRGIRPNGSVRRTKPSWGRWGASRTDATVAAREAGGHRKVEATPLGTRLSPGDSVRRKTNRHETTRRRRRPARLLHGPIAGRARAPGRAVSGMTPRLAETFRRSVFSAAGADAVFEAGRDRPDSRMPRSPCAGGRRRFRKPLPAADASPARLPRLPTPEAGGAERGAKLFPIPDPANDETLHADAQ
ncbi:MAG: hypothetical protein H0U65_17140 [Rubrobacter sp.]|nr:hypothetical protein [Rubrobacter sp.]